MDNSISAADATHGSLQLWLPTLLWMIALFVLSTSVFSAANTSKVIVPILRFLLPGAAEPTIMILHGLVRKAAHFTNYGILFWILIRGPMAALYGSGAIGGVINLISRQGHEPGFHLTGELAGGYPKQLEKPGSWGGRAMSTTAVTWVRWPCGGGGACPRTPAEHFLQAHDLLELGKRHHF